MSDSASRGTRTDQWVPQVLVAVAAAAVLLTAAAAAQTKADKQEATDAPEASSESVSIDPSGTANPATSPDTFKPSKRISVDEPVTFPVDI